jgi:hypothetical protein
MAMTFGEKEPAVGEMLLVQGANLRLPRTHAPVATKRLRLLTTQSRNVRRQPFRSSLAATLREVKSGVSSPSNVMSALRPLEVQSTRQIKTAQGQARPFGFLRTSRQYPLRKYAARRKVRRKSLETEAPTMRDFTRTRFSDSSKPPAMITTPKLVYQDHVWMSAKVGNGSQGLGSTHDDLGMLSSNIATSGLTRPLSRPAQAQAQSQAPKRVAIASEKPLSKLNATMMQTSCFDPRTRDDAESRVSTCWEPVPNDHVSIALTVRRVKQDDKPVQERLKPLVLFERSSTEIGNDV